MGAEPRGLLLSLALRSGDAVRDVLALISTVHRVGLQYGAPLIGGDLSATAGPLVVSVTALGEAAPNRVLRRYAARVGDRLLVSGALGGAAVALRAFMQGALVPPLVARRQLRPEPKIALGRFLARQAGVRSCADISDGIAGDALHLVPRGLGVEIDPLLLPIDPAVRRLAAKLGLSAQHLALCGGEDFELVLAADPRAVSRILQGAARLGCPLTPIGVVRRGRGLRLLRARVKGLEAFAHFH
jgi:thiamine-monophosphate kinase